MPAGGLAIRSRAALGISLPVLWPAREVLSLDWDWQGWVTPTQRIELRLRPRKPGLKQNLGDESPLGTEPRWDADRRARSDERAPCPYGTEMKTCVCRRSASLFLSSLQAQAKQSSQAGGIIRQVWSF